MPVTRELLARLRNLDDLVEFVSALGYQPHPEDLNAEARTRLGLAGPALGVRRGAVLSRAGTLTVYGILADNPTRAAVGDAAQRLARATAGCQHLLLALDVPGTTLACAAAAPFRTSGPSRQLRVPLRGASAVALEILAGLAVRNGDGGLRLASRICDALAEEGLTGRFFRDFRRLHSRAADALVGAPRATATERRDLTLVTLTRVLFLYFVQAKGWLAGRSDFLPSALDTALGRGHPFHRTVFEPLCFGALNTPVPARTAAALSLGDLPFLNGGLFERHRLERRHPEVELPDPIWRELFDGLFERFHFTLREDSEADAVDPEMLGRVFEGLMAPVARRVSGTYFTPRALVEAVVRKALDAACPTDDVRRLRALRLLDPAVGSGAFLLEALRQVERRRGPLLPGETAAERRRAIVRDNLFGVDADPMAVRLAELRLWLALVVDECVSPAEVAPLPNLDLNVRQGDSLISPLDADGAALCTDRGLWHAVAERKASYFAASGPAKTALARAIREDEREAAVAGLDAAIEALTARLADAAAASGRDLFGRRARRSRVLDHRAAEWRRRRAELLRIRGRVLEDGVLPFFSYDVHFGETAAAGGFDVVLGNPPWVRGEALSPGMRALLQRRYDAWRASTGRAGFSHLPDLSVAFVERALELVRPGGVVAFVLPAKLLRAGYASRLRALLRRDATVLAIDDRAHAATDGFAATVFPMTLVLRREAPRTGIAAQVAVAGASGRTMSGAADLRDLSIDGATPGASWVALPGDLVGAVRSALRSGVPLHSRFRPTLGVKTGANAVFVRNRDEADALPTSCRAPALLGRDVSPFGLDPSAVILAAVDSDGRALASVPADVRDYLEAHATVLRRRSDARGTKLPPWALFRTDLLRCGWVVVWRDIAPRLEAAVLHRPGRTAPIPLNTCYGVAVPDERTAAWLTAILNSRIVRSIAAVFAERASGGSYRFSASAVGALPLPTDPDAPPVRALEALGRGAQDGEAYDPDHLDALVARAIGLDVDTTERLRFLGDALCRDARWRS